MVKDIFLKLLYCLINVFQVSGKLLAHSCRSPIMFIASIVRLLLAKLERYSTYCRMLKYNEMQIQFDNKGTLVLVDQRMSLGL
jgi:hypothetical protein